jgi:hypothetical protein
MRKQCQGFESILLVCLLLTGRLFAQNADPLPSWNQGEAKQAIIDFVAKVTNKGAPNYVPPAERIAVFDHDGCLWCEQPLYFQALVIFDRVK